MGEKLFCHNCFENVDYNLGKEKRKYEIKSREYEILDTITICAKCGEEIFNREEDSKILIELNNRYRKEHGLLFPEEIKKIRESYNLTQEEFSKLLGFRKNTITRYECGAIQNIEDNNKILSLK